MSKHSRLGMLLLCLLIAGIAAGASQIFRIRILSGEYYPKWSSLRSEPDGTRVLFDALAGTGRVETMRKYQTLAVEPARASTVLYLGFSPAALINASNDDLDQYEKAARAGNRIVIALDPSAWFNPPAAPADSPLRKRWDVAVDAIPAANKTDEEPRGLFFTRARGWTSDAALNGRYIVVERAFGSGNVVLAANSAMFSNQALAENASTSLIARIVGPNARVIFDESHLGIQESGSVLGLVHKYRLDGALWGLFALAAVFVWGHAVGFPPAQPSVSTTTLGHDAGGGLAQLLRRQVPPSRVVDECLSQWRHSHSGHTLHSPPPKTDPVEAYRALQQELTHK